MKKSKIIACALAGIMSVGVSVPLSACDTINGKMQNQVEKRAEEIVKQKEELNVLQSEKEKLQGELTSLQEENKKAFEELKKISSDSKITLDENNAALEEIKALLNNLKIQQAELLRKIEALQAEIKKQQLDEKKLRVASPFGDFQTTWNDIISDANVKDMFYRNNDELDVLLKSNELHSPDVFYSYSSAAMSDFSDLVITRAELENVDPLIKGDIDEKYLGKMYEPACYPFRKNAELLMYNKNILDESDFSGTVFNMTEKIKEYNENNNSNGRKAIAVRGDLPHYWFNYFMATELGVEEFSRYPKITYRQFWNAGEKTSTYHGWYRAAKIAAKQCREIGFVGAYATGNEQEFYNASRYGSLLDGSWAAGNLDSELTEGRLGNLGITTLPGKNIGDERFSIGGTMGGWYVTKKCWNDLDKRKAAIKFLKKVNKKETIGKLCESFGGIPLTDVKLDIGTNRQKFYDVGKSVKCLLAIDDRISSNAKASLLSNWTDKSLPYKIFAGEIEPTEKDYQLWFDNFVSMLD